MKQKRDDRLVFREPEDMRLFVRDVEDAFSRELTNGELAITRTYYSYSCFGNRGVLLEGKGLLLHLFWERSFYGAEACPVAFRRSWRHRLWRRFLVITGLESNEIQRWPLALVLRGADFDEADTEQCTPAKAAEMLEGRWDTFTRYLSDRRAFAQFRRELKIQEDLRCSPIARPGPARARQSPS